MACLSVTLLAGCGLTANKDTNHILSYAMGEKWQTLDSSKANDRASYTLIHTIPMIRKPIQSHSKRMPNGPMEKK